jgi:hypothetical protein
VVSTTDPHGRILETGAATISSKQLLDCTQEAEWTPSENLVVPGIEPGPLDL